MKALITLFILISISSECLGQNSSKTLTNLEAARAVPCSDKVTDIFAMATVSVEDRSGKAITLESYSVHNLIDDVPLPVNPFSMDPTSALAGWYPMLTDSEIAEYGGRDIEVRFQGYLAGKLVIDEKYTVGFHCGHVHGGQGKWKIILP